MNLTEIAAACGVSAMTVSRVLNGSPLVNEKTRTRVQAALDRVGYVPSESARRLVKSRDNMPYVPSRPRIGILGASHFRKVDDFYCAQLLMGMEAEMQHNRDVLVFAKSYCDFLDDPKAFDYLVANNPLDGMIVFSWHDEVREFFATRLPADFPIVAVNLNTSTDSITVNYSEIIRLMLDYLSANGHTRIGYLGVSEPWFGAYEIRFQEFMAQTRLRGIRVPDEWIPAGGNFLEPDSGERLGKKLLDAATLPTAMVCVNDQFAISALKAFRDAGVHVPEQLSLISYDDIPLASMVHPALTTIRVDYHRMGRRAVQMLEECIRSPRHPRRCEQFSGELIVRESVGVAIGQEEPAVRTR